MDNYHFIFLQMEKKKILQLYEKTETNNFQKNLKFSQH